MKKILILLTVIVAMITAGYFVWDRSYNSEVSDQDREQISQMMSARGYSTADLVIAPLFDKYDHAKYLYAYNGHEYLIAFKGKESVVESGEGKPFASYSPEEYKLYYFAPGGCYAGPLDMSFKETKGKGLLHNIHAEQMEEIGQ